MNSDLFNLVGVDFPPLCGEEDKLQSEALGSAADPVPYPICLHRGSLISAFLQASSFRFHDKHPVLGKLDESKDFTSSFIDKSDG